MRIRLFRSMTAALLSIKSMQASNRYRVETYPARQGVGGDLYRLIDEESGVQFTVAPFAGAEITSIQTRHNGHWLEILDRAEDFTPCDRWRGRAPWLGDSTELNFREGRSLSDSRLHNLIVGHFAPDQAIVRVVDPSGLQIEIGQRELTNNEPAKAPADGFYYIFYGLPEHHIFCPEPWLGLPNALNTRRPIVELQPGQRFEWEMTVNISCV